MKEEKKEGRGDSRGIVRGSVRKTPGMSRVNHVWLGSVCIGDVDVCFGAWISFLTCTLSAVT